MFPLVLRVYIPFLSFVYVHFDSSILYTCRSAYPCAASARHVSRVLRLLLMKILWVQWSAAAATAAAAIIPHTLKLGHLSVVVVAYSCIHFSWSFGIPFFLYTAAAAAFALAKLMIDTPQRGSSSSSSSWYITKIQNCCVSYFFIFFFLFLRSFFCITIPLARARAGTYELFNATSSSKIPSLGSVIYTERNENHGGALIVRYKHIVSTSTADNRACRRE